MPSPFTPPYRAVLLAALALSSQSVLAAEPSPSLAEKRLGIIKGTTPGIVLLDFGNAPRAKASAPVGTPAAAVGGVPAAGVPTSTGATAPNPPNATSGFLNALPPPSGRSLQSARRLDAPDQGIALPTARAASQPQVEPAKR